MPGFGKSGISRIFARSVSADMGFENLRVVALVVGSAEDRAGGAGPLVYPSRHRVLGARNRADPPGPEQPEERADERHGEHRGEGDAEPVATRALPGGGDGAGDPRPEGRPEDVRQLERGAGRALFGGRRAAEDDERDR